MLYNTKNFFPFLTTSSVFLARAPNDNWLEFSSEHFLLYEKCCCCAAALESSAKYCERERKIEIYIHHMVEHWWTWICGFIYFVVSIVRNKRDEFHHKTSFKTTVIMRQDIVIMLRVFTIKRAREWYFNDVFSVWF